MPESTREVRSSQTARKKKTKKKTHGWNGRKTANKNWQRIMNKEVSTFVPHWKENKCLTSLAHINVKSKVHCPTSLRGSKFIPLCSYK